MNILIDIGHPAHVHLLRYTSKELLKHGHQVFFSVRDIPVAKKLMQQYGMEFLDLGKKKDTIFGKAIKTSIQDLKILICSSIFCGRIYALCYKERNTQCPLL